jgi:hypothetical protein
MNSIEPVEAIDVNKVGQTVLVAAFIALASRSVRLPMDLFALCSFGDAFISMSMGIHDDTPQTYSCFNHIMKSRVMGEGDDIIST